MLKKIVLLSMICFSISAYALSEREEVAKDIKGMIVDLSCDNSHQCKSFGFGSRPCGGYASYLIYSTKNTYEVKLDQAAAKYYKLDREHNENSEMTSICSVEQPRIAKCIKEKCVDMGDELNYKD